MTAVLIVVMVVGLVASVVLFDRWAGRRLDRHVNEALALANARITHPSARLRCMCGDVVLDSEWEARRWAATPMSEPLIHSATVCQPARESL